MAIEVQGLEIQIGARTLLHPTNFHVAKGDKIGLVGRNGAGKTALLSAIKLLVGERADASTVREGAQGAVVEGRFFLPADADNANDGHIACRKVSADGRSRVSIDGGEWMNVARCTPRRAFGTRPHHWELEVR